jgi:hypothetical protein
VPSGRLIQHGAAVVLPPDVVKQLLLRRDVMLVEVAAVNRMAVADLK